MRTVLETTGNKPSPSISDTAHAFTYACASQYTPGSFTCSDSLSMQTDSPATPRVCTSVQICYAGLKQVLLLGLTQEKTMKPSNRDVEISDFVWELLLT